MIKLALCLFLSLRKPAANVVTLQKSLLSYSRTILTWILETPAHQRVRQRNMMSLQLLEEKKSADIATLSMSLVLPLTKSV